MVKMIGVWVPMRNRAIDNLFKSFLKRAVLLGGIFCLNPVFADAIVSPMKVSVPSGCLGPQGFADIIEPLLSAVVNVSVIKKVTTYSLDFGPGGVGPGGSPGGTSPFDDLFRFRDFLEQFELAPKKRRVAAGAGSGFVIDPQGYIVTNAHVVAEAEEIIVTFSDQTEQKAQVIGRDPRTDLALLKVAPSKGLPFVRWGDSGKMRVGDWAIAVGNPLGLGGTVTLGIISYVGRSFMMQPTHIGGFLQTDAPINLGSSGGPLFNIEGRVIGINMMLASPTGGNVGIGFSIPADVAQFVIKQLREHGRVKRGWLGVQIQRMGQEIANSLGLRTPHGALVGSILEKSPASQAGIQQGDVILKLDGVLVEDSAKLIKMVSGLPIGSKVTLSIWRKNKPKGVHELIEVPITIGEFEDEDVLSKKPVGKTEKDNASSVEGLFLQELTPALRNRYNLGDSVSGLLIKKVDLESRASDLFQPGDVLLEVSQQKVTSVPEVQGLIKKAKDEGRTSMLCLIQRSNVPAFVPLPLEGIVDDSVKAPSGQ